MDPQSIKMIQRLVAELAGIGMLIWGIIFIYRGIAGKITFILKGHGFGVKLANASPGIFIAGIGAFLMWYSMQGFSVEKKTITTETSELSILDTWLQNASKIKGDENYIQIIDSVVGTASTNRFKVEYLRVHPPLTLGQISANAYGDNKYWRLIAVVNNGKEYFDWNNLSINTIVKDSSLIEMWKVSKYYGKTSEELIKVRGADKVDAYRQLLDMAKSRPDYKPLEHFQELSDLYKTRELNLVQTPANFSGGIETIGELSLKYYGDKSLWPIIAWTNKTELADIEVAEDRLDKSKTIFILHFIP